MEGVCAICGNKGDKVLLCCKHIACDRCIADAHFLGACTECFLPDKEAAHSREILISLSRLTGNCRFCAHACQPGEWDNHFNSRCPGFPVRCILQGCGRDMTRGQWMGHALQCHFKYMEGVLSSPA